MEQQETTHDSIIAYAKDLRLSSIWRNYTDATALAREKNWSIEEFLQHILKTEYKSRIENRRKAQIRRAGFPEHKYLKELSKKDLPVDMSSYLAELESLEFIKTGQNIVLAGNPGTGKTHVAIGLGINACMAGYNVFFTSVPHLLTQIRECRSQRTLRQLQLKFEKFDLVICDEFGYISCDKEGAELLFNHLSLRSGRKATIITTNLSFDRWNEIFLDPILTAAMVDRLTHRAFLINMNGNSFRMMQTKEWLNNKKKNS